MSGPFRKLPYFRAWLVFFLIATAGGAIVGGLSGLFLGIALSVAKFGPDTIKHAATALGFALGIPISYFTFRWVVSELIVKEALAEPPMIAAGPPPEPAQEGRETPRA